MQTDPNKVTQEFQAGVKVAMLEFGWNNFEPQDGVFNASYIAQQKQKLDAYKAAGMKVVLGFGLHYPPSWVFNYPNSKFKNQYGIEAGQVNLVFNNVLRQKAQAYIDRINQDLGIQNFWAIRITAGGDPELLFPDMNDVAGHTDSFWAYDVNAQNGVDKPASISPNPYPGWKIGQTTYNGQPFSTTQAKNWLDWYIGTIDDSANWQIQYFKTKFGFTGYFQLLTPGSGTRPDGYQNSINNLLKVSDFTTGRAAVWHKVYELLPDKQKVVAYVSSMADGSGGNDVCSSDDSLKQISDTSANSWSAARWISFLAGKYSLLKSGENPGFGDGNNPYGLNMMNQTASQMAACQMQGMFWAHDFNLYDGTSGVTLPDYANVINSYNRTPSPTPTSPPRIPGDIEPVSGDGDVDIFDYNQLVSDFGRTGSGLMSDIDPEPSGDGDVDIFDYNVLVTNFGRSSP